MTACRGQSGAPSQLHSSVGCLHVHPSYRPLRVVSEHCTCLCVLHEGQRLVLRVFLCCSPPYFSETRSLSEPGAHQLARMAGQKPQESPWVWLLVQGLPVWPTTPSLYHGCCHSECKVSCLHGTLPFCHPSKHPICTSWIREEGTPPIGKETIHKSVT